MTNIQLSIVLAVLGVFFVVTVLCLIDTFRFMPSVRSKLSRECNEFDCESCLCRALNNNLCQCECHTKSKERGLNKRRKYER